MVNYLKNNQNLQSYYANKTKIDRKRDHSFKKCRNYYLFLLTNCLHSSKQLFLI